MKAPSTVWTPIALVVNAISPVITRMVVMTGSSLTKRSLAQRISRKTICRPTVKLTPRNRAVPARLWPSDHRSIAPCDASPKTTDMMIQPDRVVDDRGGDDDLADGAAQKADLAHHHRHDLDRGDRQRDPKEQRGDQPLARIGQHRIRQQLAKRETAHKRQRDAAD